MVELRICVARVFPGRVSYDHSYEESNQFTFIFRYGVLTLKTIEMALLTNSMILYRITWKNPNILAMVHWWLVVIKWSFTSCSKILVFNPLGETLSIVLFTDNKINMRNRNINATNIPWLNITNCHFSSGARFSRLPKRFRTRKAIAKFRTLCLQLWLQSCFIHIFFFISREVLFIQEVNRLAGSKCFQGTRETSFDWSDKSKLCRSLKNVFYADLSDIYGCIFNEIFRRNVCVFLIRVRELFQFVSFTLKRIYIFRIADLFFFRWFFKTF